jgi:hypothetical protein
MTQPSISRDEALKRVDELLQSLTAQNIAGAAGLLHSEVAWISDVFEDGRTQGVGNVQEQLARYLEAFAPKITLGGLEDDLEEATFENGRLIVHFALEGVQKGEFPGIGLTQRPYRVSGVATITFNDAGDITRVRTHWNCSLMLAQLGIRTYARPGPIPD